MGYKFLSDEWFAEVEKLRDAAGDLEVPEDLKAMMINLNVNDGDKTHELSLQAGMVVRGHADGADTTVTVPADVAQKVFIQGDAAAGMQAFMAGQIQVEGDMTKLMQMQTMIPSDKQKALGKQIMEITE